MAARFCEVCGTREHKTTDHKCQICNANDHSSIDDAFHPIKCSLCLHLAYGANMLINRLHSTEEHKCSRCGSLGVQEYIRGHKCEYCYKCGVYGHSDTVEHCAIRGCFSITHKMVDHECPLGVKGECKITNGRGEIGRGHGIEKHECEFCKSMMHGTQYHPCGFDGCTILNVHGTAGLGHEYGIHLCKYCKSTAHTTENHKCKMCGKIGHDIDSHCNCEPGSYDSCEKIGHGDQCKICQGNNHECEDVLADSIPTNLEQAISDITKLRCIVFYLSKNVAKLNKRLDPHGR